MIAIIGGGMSGVSAGYHLNLKGIDNIVYEKRSSWGGLCDNFVIDGFLFDYFVHLSFSKNLYVQQLFKDSSDFYTHKPVPYNYYKNYWIKHPAQFHLHSLPNEMKINIILDFINRPIIDSPQNYNDWLVAAFGKYFTDHFPSVYNYKYWTIPIERLTTDWIGKRMKEISLRQILNGAFEPQDENHYYASEMIYPIKGGYKSFMSKMAGKTKISTNKNAVLIDLKNKKIDFSDGSSNYFDKLISSIPLPDLVKITKDMPRTIKAAAENLSYSSGQLVSLGFNKHKVAEHLWFYIYDKDFLPARAYSPSNKSINNAPEGKSSLQFETYFSAMKKKELSKDYLVEHIVNKGIEMDLFTANDLIVADYREVKYANVIFDNKRKQNSSVIREFFRSKGVKTIGRFGEWDYFWSDQSLLSGKKVADEL